MYHIQEDKKDMQDQKELLQAIPVSIRNMAEVEHLGESVAVVDQSKNPGKYASTIFGVGVIVIVFLTVALLGLAFAFIKIYEATIGILSVILVFATLIGYLDVRKRTHDQTVVYDSGLLFMNRGKITVLPWNRIDRVFRGKRITTRYSGYTDIDTMQIYDQDENLYRIDANTPKHQRAWVCDALERGLVEDRIMQIQDIYERGGELLFGQLKLSKKGIDDGQEILPWSQVEYISVDSDFVSIRMQGRTSTWYSEWGCNIPNVCLFREMAASIRHSRR